MFLLGGEGVLCYNPKFAQCSLLLEFYGSTSDCVQIKSFTLNSMAHQIQSSESSWGGGGGCMKVCHDEKVGHAGLIFESQLTVSELVTSSNASCTPDSRWAYHVL